MSPPAGFLGFLTVLHPFQMKESDKLEAFTDIQFIIIIYIFLLFHLKYKTALQ